MIKPIYMLADSQLLFCEEPGARFLEQVRQRIDSPNPKAAYLGASNGDNAEFFSLFQAAMAAIDVSTCRMIPSSLTEEDKNFLANADLVLLAGGDVELGWKVFAQNGVKDLITQMRYGGAVLMGVSAGAVQLGRGTLLESEIMKELALFQFAPFYVAAHEEQNEWWNLRAVVNLAGDGSRGIGIPAGGGLIYDSDGSIEAVRKPAVEFSKRGDAITEYLLIPENG
jgi:peptidase E